MQPLSVTTSSFESRSLLESSFQQLGTKGLSFQSLKGAGFKANYRETKSGDQYWISGPRRDGLDRLYGKSALVVEIDDDVREEYWTEIRKESDHKGKRHT